jgi:hypothetical protein
MGTHISASSPTSDPIGNSIAGVDLSHHTPMMHRRKSLYLWLFGNK